MIRITGRQNPADSERSQWILELMRSQITGELEFGEILAGGMGQTFELDLIPDKQFNECYLTDPDGEAINFEIVSICIKGKRIDPHEDLTDEDLPDTVHEIGASDG